MLIVEDKNEMALISANELKRKLLIQVDGQPYVVLEVFFASPTARGAATMVRTRLRQLLTGAVLEKSFRSSEKFAEPDFRDVGAGFDVGDRAGQAIGFRNPFGPVLGAKLVGVGVEKSTLEGIRAIACADPHIEQVGHLFTMYLGPQEVMLVIEVRFRPGSTADVRASVGRLTRSIQEKYPKIRRVSFDSISLTDPAPPPEE